MKQLKNLIAVGTVMAMAATSAHSLSAQDYTYDVGGCGYDDCRQAPCLTPAIALGAIALVAIIAVAVSNSSHCDHCHGHD